METRSPLVHPCTEKAIGVDLLVPPIVYPCRGIGNRVGQLRRRPLQDKDGPIGRQLGRVRQAYGRLPKATGVPTANSRPRRNRPALTQVKDKAADWPAAGPS